MPSARASLIAAALGDELTESQASVRIFLTAGGLAVLGCALLLFTIWWWRGTKPEPPALGPLEVMSDRRWQSASDSERRRLVEVNRPDAALRLEGVQAPVPIDLSVLARDQHSGFDDLRDDPARWPYGASESAPSADGSVLGLGSPPDDTDEPNDIEPIQAVEETAADDTAADDTAVDDTAVDPVDPLVAAGADETMYQVQRPAEEADASSAADLDHELDHFDDQDDEPSDEMVIDPLLQRTAAQE
jgi:hypothetical protein